MCLFLEQWEDERSELRAYSSTQAAYKRWKEQTLAYYAANAVKCSEPEELDRDGRKLTIKGREVDTTRLKIYLVSVLMK